MPSTRTATLHLLTGMLIATLVFPAILFIFASGISYGTTHRIADQRIERSLDVLQEHALKIFESVNLTLLQVDQLFQGLSDDVIRSREETYHRQLRQAAHTLSQVEAVWVFDRDGFAVVASNVFPIPRTVNFQDRDYFKAVADKDIGIYIGEIITPRIPAVPPTPPFFPISRRRASAEGSFTGVIEVSVLPANLQQFYAKIGRDPGSYFAMLRPDGAFLARYPSPADPTARLDERSGFRQQIARNAEGGFYTSGSFIDNTERRIGARKLPGYPIYVNAGIEAQTIRQEWLSSMGSHLIFGLPITAFLFLALSFAYRRTQNMYREAERREMAENILKQSQKMDAIGQLTGGVAHDFNNLLTIIIGNLETILRKGADPGIERFVNNAMTGARRAAQLTRRLLAFSRQQPLDPKPTDVNRTIAGMSDMLSRSLGETIEIETVAAGGLWQVEVDSPELEAVLLNLVLNARDAMPNGGKLTIETANAFLDEAYCRQHGELSPGQYVMIAITDTGGGMSQEVISRAFEPFFTTKGAGQGTGLGLSQVYGFVKQSKGHVKIYSELSHGTTMKIYLPRRYGEVTETRIEQPESENKGAGETILVVEDDNDVRSYITELLRGLNYRVFEAPNADIALKIVDQKDDRIDLLLTDVVLPGMNGRQLAEEVKSRRLDTKILFMTGYSRNAIVHQGRLDPGVHLIQKPLSETNFAARVRDILNTR